MSYEWRVANGYSAIYVARTMKGIFLDVCSLNAASERRSQGVPHHDSSDSATDATPSYRFPPISRLRPVELSPVVDEQLPRANRPNSGTRCQRERWSPDGQTTLAELRLSIDFARGAANADGVTAHAMEQKKGAGARGPGPGAAGTRGRHL